MQEARALRLGRSLGSFPTTYVYQNLTEAGCTYALTTSQKRIGMCSSGTA